MFDNSKKFIQAVKEGDDTTVMRYLKKYWYKLDKVDLGAKDETGMTAVAHAARLGHVEMIKQMQRHHLKLETPDKDGHSPLVIAILNKQSPAAVALVEAGANVNAHGADYIYPLHYAAYNSDIDLAKKLVNYGAELNAVITTNGYTALHWAINQGHAAMAEFLVQAGARLDMPDKAGRTAVDIAKSKGAHMEKILSAAPAKTVAPTEDDATEKWVRNGKRLTHITEHPEINRRLTEIFNFETRERTLLSENLSSGTETLNPPERFDYIGEDAVKKALGEFRRLGGEIDDSKVFPPRAAAPRPFRP